MFLMKTALTSIPSSCISTCSRTCANVHIGIYILILLQINYSFGLSNSLMLHCIATSDVLEHKMASEPKDYYFYMNDFDF